MPITYFIADLHLSADRPDITSCLETFLSEEATQADALYVLGDLFEAWLGDDDINEFTTRVTNAFKALSNKGIPIFFIHGNRDFLVRKAFVERAGMALLPEEQVVNLYGQPTLIMHGDQLCTRDVAYQKFRKKSRGWWWPRLILMLPLSTRRNIADNGRKKSKQKQKNLSLEIMDVTPDEVVKSMEKHQVARLIHGHTHRPDIHSLETNGTPSERIVLGDWYTQGSVLAFTPEGYELQTRCFTE